MVAGAALAGCGDGGGSSGDGGGSSSDENASDAAEISPPGDLQEAGVISFCSEIDFPPFEFLRGSEPVGADIEIGNNIAHRLGVDAEFNNLGFDALIGSLLAKKCDAILSAMNITPERAEQIAFIPYIKVGQSFIVTADSGLEIAKAEDLSGMVVATLTGSTQVDYLDDANSKLESQGKAPIDVVTFPKDTEALNLVRTGRADAYFTSSGTAAHIAKTDPTVVVAGSPVNPVEDGIGVRLDSDDLEQALQKAVDRMYEDGTMAAILEKWDLEGAALEGS